MAYDTIIKNGTIVDGSGAPGYRGDVAIKDNRIAAVGEVSGNASNVIDADGHLVTPGFVDIHTHLDAQITWDPTASSSCWHGVTSVVMGNCGVTFAPCKPADREYLARIMESVEDIPAKSIMAGMPWSWQHYSEYLTALDGIEKGINVGGLVGHVAVRIFAMGERALDATPANPDEIALMKAAVSEAVAGGALGFSTSRTPLHVTPEGEAIPGTYASVEELKGICSALGELGRGVVEAATGINGTDEETVRRKLDLEVPWMRDVSLATGRPVTFGLAQGRETPTAYAKVLERVQEANNQGANLNPQSTTRGIGVLFGFQNRTPFDRANTWRALRGMPMEEKLARLRDPQYRAVMVRESTENPPPLDMSQLFVMPVDTPRYDQRPQDSLEAHAQRMGTSAPDAFIQLSIDESGLTLFNYPFLNPEPEAVEAMLKDPNVVLGLGDSGAHCGQIMDASLPTYYLSHWVRDRGEFSVEHAIHKLTAEPAALYGMKGRGSLAPGAFADINVINLAGMSLHGPRFVNDFPGGAGRFIQRANGYAYTFVNGQMFMRNGEHTGALTGTVLRSGD
ncbi:MAG: amidohydrolase family protein [Chromatiales bacterium]|jgi:N-acyl-D-amino-acid deacylase|nr:amidohydrolase family protein [Chromatiales bacterium]